jgi:hypothetical protein
LPDAADYTETYEAMKVLALQTADAKVSVEFLEIRLR